MASVNGAYGGLDVYGIVSGLMKYEKTHLNQLNATKTKLDQQTENYNKITDSLEKLSSNLDNLSLVWDKNSYQIASSNDNTVSALLNDTSFAVAGNHTLNINQLAQAHKIAGASFAARDEALGVAETLVLLNSLDEEILNVSINPEDTLEQIRDNINNAEINEGMVAVILANTENGVAQYRLVLQSTMTGNEGIFSLPPANESALLGVAQGGDPLNILTQGQNAEFTIDGFEVERSSNTFSDVVDGMTMTLNATGNATITVTEDTVNWSENVAAALQSIVDNYNGIMSFIDQNQSFFKLKDTTLSHIKMYLQTMMTQPLGGEESVHSLFDLGLNLEPSETLMNSDGVEYTLSGKMKVDAEKLLSAMNQDEAGVKAFFTQSDFFIPGQETAKKGFIQYAIKSIQELTQTTGPIVSRVDMIAQQALRNEMQITNEENRLTRVEAQLTERFIKLDTLLTMQDKKLNWVTMQLESLENMMTKK